MKSNNTTWLAMLMIIVVIVVGVGAFLGGMSVQKSKDKTSATTVSTNRGGFPSAGGAAGSGSGRRMGFGGLSGTIASVSSSGITITTSSGSTETINFGSSTTFASQATASESDLTVGKAVTVTPDFSSMQSGDTSSGITATKITLTN
jgi:hypothetical protein